MEQLHTKR